MKSRFITLLILVPLFFQACEDVLEERVYSYDSPTNFYKDQESAIAAVNSCYKSNTGYGTIGYWGQMLTELATDFSAGDNNIIFMMSNGTYDASSDPVRWSWIGWYTGIHNCNVVLERVKPVEMDEDIKNRIFAEAKFIRAYNYFMLVRLFGPIPLREKSVQTDDDVHTPRAPIADVYGLIVDDLKFAEENLWHFDEYAASDLGRASIEAAKGLLSIVYLTMAGEPMNQTANYQAARDKAMELIELKGGLAAASSMLANNYMDVFGAEKVNKYNPENLFIINHVRQNEAGTPLTTQYAVTPYYSGATWPGGYRYSLNFYKTFEEGDLRAKYGFHHVFFDADENILFWPDTIDDGTIPQWGEAPPEGATLADILPAITKYDDPGAPTKNQSGVAIPVLRMAEVLLVFAEAENEVNGATKDAFTAVNAVRDRAGLPPAENIITASPDKVTFREFIIDERAKELFGENKRRFDLLRTGKFIEKMQAEGKPAEEKHKLFPIPLEELNGNNQINAEDQNPGY